MTDSYTVRDSLETAARRLRMHAEQYPPWDGTTAPYYRLQHLDTASGIVTLAIYSRDTGHHTSGWFKNPDYERCYHLSLSFCEWRPLAGVGLTRIPFQLDIARKLVPLVFQNWQRYIWIESAKSPAGIEAGVTHYRVFCDPSWQPIVPRGEVYSQEFTEKGWQSWSAQHGDPHASHLVHENPDR
jgi:hypothetical protein